MAKIVNKSKFSPQIFALTFIILILGNEACNLRRLGETTGKAVAQELSSAVKDTSARLESIMKESITKLDSNLRVASNTLENSAKTLANSMDKSTAELGSSIRTMSNDLVKISNKLTSSVDKGVEEMSLVLREAIEATQGITKQLSNSVDKAVIEIGRQVENAVNKVQEIVKDLTRSVDNAVDELGRTLRYLADALVEVSKQFNLRVDSGDIVDLGKEMKEGLVQSITQLTNNWKVAVSTADLKNVGAAAFEELSKALQNIQMKLHIKVEIDENTRLAVRDISIAVGIAFSVLFIALVIALKSCRTCTVNCVRLIITECSKTRHSPPADEEMGKENGDLELQEIKHGRTRKRSNSKQRSDVKAEKEYDSDFDEDLSSTNDEIDSETDFVESKRNRTFDKRLTKSYLDYKNFDTLKAKWEKREFRDKQGEASQKQIKTPRLLNPD